MSPPSPPQSSSTLSVSSSSPLKKTTLPLVHGCCGFISTVDLLEHVHDDNFVNILQKTTTSGLIREHERLEAERRKIALDANCEKKLLKMSRRVEKIEAWFGSDLESLPSLRKLIDVNLAITAVRQELRYRGDTTVNAITTANNTTFSSTPSSSTSSSRSATLSNNPRGTSRYPRPSLSSSLSTLSPPPPPPQSSSRPLRFFSFSYYSPSSSSSPPVNKYSLASFFFCCARDQPEEETTTIGQRLALHYR